MKSKILTFMFLWGFFSIASAVNATPFGCEGKSIRVGITNAGVMYHNGVGIDPDLLHLLSAITHCQFQLIPIARADAFELVKQGKIDLVPSVTREPSREAYAWFIPYFEVRFVLLTNATKLPAITHIEQLKSFQNIRIGRAAGSGYGSYFNYHLSEMSSLGMVKSYSDYGESVKGLLNKEVDAVLSMPQLYRAFLAEGEAPLPLRIADISPAPAIQVSLMLGKHQFSSPQAANWLRVIEMLRLDGRLKAIMEQYVSSDEAHVMLGNAAPL
ncbi:substrate-binding periplasmic protein [Marinomonas pollencensis]|uniref:ABC-type amino acid transport substrate-binding protein n=1 Tax=Marinomonas pollencensis TaxID=491954 RepID=A0A3E0DRL7_9GAMM|nr:ABC transporter substrate-binding protein [Marinomonas pollencensis]REG85654.1 ABC-type amino acid transport substrate-binding protein [Marinomonas pollencensis]